LSKIKDMQNTQRHAFSLVELSIVLVILGLLVGGVLSGQSLIRAAQLRAVSTEYARYTTAAQSFRDKYFAIPGDMANATAFWGYTGGTGCTNSSGTAATTPGTCDGNGNGIIDNAPATAGQSGEVFQFWRQLAFAGLIEGTYSGINTGANNASTLSVNVPASKLPTGGWSVRNLGSLTGNTVLYDGTYGNTFEYGGTTGAGSTNVPILKPEELWNIDTKFDDGKPASGSLIARYWNNLCSAADDGTSASNDLAASYRLSDSTAQCAFYIRNIF
jgi:prepilin-type N-terminal cleavage/methylation domain-containing protein